MEITKDHKDRPPALRRSLRIRNRDERRRREEVERKEIEERGALIRLPKRLTKLPTCKSASTVMPKRRKIFRYINFSQIGTTVNLTNIPLDLLIYTLEFLGPSLAAMERVSKSFYRIIRGQHSPYRFLYYKLLAMYCPVDASSMIENDEQERAIHAPVLPKIQKTLAKKEFREYKVSDWKVCTICAEPGDPIPVWEPWKTYVYDLGMHCTFYLRSQLDHLRRQKYSDPQIALDRDVEQRQSERFSKENAKRKRKQKEQDDSYTERTKSILKCFEELKLKPDLNVMEEWWFPKELKLEIQETNNSLARKRLRISMEQDNANGNTSSGSIGVTGSDTLIKSKSLRKNLDEIMTELRNVVVPRVSRLMDLNSRLMADGIAVDKLRMDLDLKTRRVYDDFVLGGMPIEDYPLTAAITRSEILAYFTRERIFETSIISTWYSSITNDDFLCCHLERPRFLRDAREWWARRGKKPPPEKCGELYLARVRKRQVWLKNDMSLVTIQENWRRELLEQPPEKLKPMYCDYEDFIKNCNGFCPTEDGYCGCLEYAAKDIIRANTILRRRDWMDAQLRKCQEINYRGPDLLLCPEAKEEYYYAARTAVMYICRAEKFMRRLISEVPTFSAELITSEARDWYKRCLGIVSDFYDPPRRPCSWAAFTTNCYYYEVHNNIMERPDIDFTIRKIYECELTRISRLEAADNAAKEARLSPSFWNKAMVKRPMDGVSFATRVRWIASNGWFSLNQLAQSWVYDEGQAPLSQLEPYIKEKVKQMEREKRKEDITSRIKDHPEYQMIFKEVDEDPEFFLRATYEINTIYKVSNLYKSHVEDVKPGIDPNKVVRQVIDLIRDVKTGVISKSSLFVADRERFAEEEDDDDDNAGGVINVGGAVNNGGGANVNNNNNITNPTMTNPQPVITNINNNAGNVVGNNTNSTNSTSV
ncbi:2382_t:CDS:10 [Dentiscutata erythropus]|uniref:2382_t:CDS:1 n=1 Tax=Dentiscutata erythropus TaxID=1348616 RepID=A0A9N9BAD3_9GLOM|nr:2382_t:CDS:10 [Dentiscutata erythropus]